MGLNLNLNNFQPAAQKATASKSPAQNVQKRSSNDEGAKGFQSELESKTKQNLPEKKSYDDKTQSAKSNDKSVESKGLNEKPIGNPGPNVGLPKIAESRTPVSMDRVIPQGPAEGASQAEMNQPALQTDALGRRVAWQQFLQKMKSELDISAEDIMAAFQSLTPEELAQPPENNIEKLVESLGLNPEQSQMAAQMFNTLLAKTGSRPLDQELKNSGRDINLTLMSQREQEQKKLSDTLDRMNQQFFMKGSEEVTGEQGSDSKLAGLGLAKAGADSFSAASAPVNSIPASSSSVGILKDMSPVSPEEGKNLLQQMSTQSGEAAAKVSTETLAANQTAAPVAPQNPLAAALQAAQSKMDDASNVVQSEDDLQSSMVKNDLKLVSSDSQNPAAGLIKDAEGEDQEMEMDLSAQSFGAEGMGVESGVEQAGFKDALESLAASAGIDQSSDHMSTEDLIQKAQVMIRDGGGDVKVILQPEGLGEVAMKISVQGDKVNVEMITESDAAKKLLEKGMGDLKTHLLASNLQLDSIKVDTASQMGQQLEQQYQDAQRQAASNFMEQFRQGNQDFRRGFSDMPGAKLYQSQTKAKGPVVEAQQASQRDSSRRLNLVA